MSGAKKSLNPGKVVYTFALGSHDLYATLDRNRDMLCCPVEYTNLPHIIMQNDKVISINNTTQVDLLSSLSLLPLRLRAIVATGPPKMTYPRNGMPAFIPRWYRQCFEERRRTTALRFAEFRMKLVNLA